MSNHGSQVYSLQSARMARSESKMQIQIALKELKVATKQLMPYRNLPSIYEALKQLENARLELIIVKDRLEK